MEAAGTASGYPAGISLGALPEEPADRIGDLRRDAHWDVGDLLVAADLGAEPLGGSRCSTSARDEHDADGWGWTGRGVCLGLGGAFDRLAQDDARVLCNLLRDVVPALQAEWVIQRPCLCGDSAYGRLLRHQPGSALGLYPRTVPGGDRGRGDGLLLQRWAAVHRNGSLFCGGAGQLARRLWEYVVYLFIYFFNRIAGDDDRR